MRIDKWAVTAQEALQGALGIAGDAEAAEIAPLHLLKALLDSNERNLRSILEKVGADVEAIEAQVDDAIGRGAHGIRRAEIWRGEEQKKVNK